MRGLRSYVQETEVDLARLGEEGLFAIFGPTGSGKSTILDGIFLSLFGRSPRGEASECVSAGAFEMGVRLEIEVGRDEAPRPFAIERRFRWSKKRDASADLDAAPVRGAPRHLPLRIEERNAGAWSPVDTGGRKPEDYLRDEIVRVSMSDFQQAVVLPQGQFDALLRARPAERRTLVASLFRTEHLGQPLFDALRAREAEVRGELARLDEAEREVIVPPEDLVAAAAFADHARSEADAARSALAAAETRAVELRIAWQRCEARDAAEAALSSARATLAARADERVRMDRARRAAAMGANLDELDQASVALEAAEARAIAAGRAVEGAEVDRRAAEAARRAATAASATRLPSVLLELGRAREANDRARDTARIDATHAAFAEAHRHTIAEHTRAGAAAFVVASAQASTAAVSAAQARELAQQCAHNADPVLPEVARAATSCIAEIDACLARIATAQARLDEARAALDDLALRADPPRRADADAFLGTEAPGEAAVAALEAERDALSRGEAEARALDDAARTAESRLALTARDAAARRDEARDRRARAERTALDVAARAGFDTLDAARAAFVAPAVLASTLAELDGLTATHDRLDAILTERRRDAAIEVRRDAANAADAARDEARSCAIDAAERAAESAARRDELGRRAARTVELRARMALLAPRAQRLAQIRQIVAANQLAELAAERHLEAVTRGAAIVLRTLSAERYSLVRAEDGSFAIADSALGGLVRPPSTLSGGETFLVSLALALSLSERIQLAGRTRFDFFFLDEGFGSLDAVTLETALGALERLRGPHRIIGMISHLAAIEERMPRKLRVHPGRPGASASVLHEIGYGLSETPRARAKNDRNPKRLGLESIRSES